MEKVAVYCRVSTEEQKQKQSIETQTEYAKQYCQREGYLMVDCYEDNGVSGTIPFEERKASNRLLQDAKIGKFKTVLVYKLDRLGRDLQIILETVFKLNALGVHIKSMTETLDRSNAQGRFIFNLFANMAEWEKEQIRDRTIDGKYRKARSGRFPGGIVPYGYRLTSDKLFEIDETQIAGNSLSPAEVVRQIFKWIGEEGMSTIAVAGRLNTLGIPATWWNGRPSSKNGKWHHDRIQQMIRSKVYIGTYVFGEHKSRSDNTREKAIISVPPIVDESLWLKSQETLRRNLKFAKRNTKHGYLLRGLIRCNFCGHGYVGWVNVIGRLYYICYGRIGHYARIYGECTGRAKKVRADWLEGVIWDEIKYWLLNPSELEETIEAKIKEYEAERGNSFKTYRKLQGTIAKKKEERERILALYRKGVISMDDVEKQFEDVAREEQKLLESIDELKARMGENLPYEELIARFREEVYTYKEKIETDSIAFEEKQRIVQAFVKEIRVNINGNKLGRPSRLKASAGTLIQTIPFRSNAAPVSLKDASIVTVYSRDNNRGKESLQPDSKGNFVEVLYHFPFPPKENRVTGLGLLRQSK